MSTTVTDVDVAVASVFAEALRTFNADSVLETGVRSQRAIVSHLHHHASPVDAARSHDDLPSSAELLRRMLRYLQHMRSKPRRWEQHGQDTAEVVLERHSETVVINIVVYFIASSAPGSLYGHHHHPYEKGSGGSSGVFVTPAEVLEHELPFLCCAAHTQLRQIQQHALHHHDGVAMSNAPPLQFRPPGQDATNGPNIPADVDYFWLGYYVLLAVGADGVARLLRRAAAPFPASKSLSTGLHSNGDDLIRDGLLSLVLSILELGEAYANIKLCESGSDPVAVPASGTSVPSDGSPPRPPTFRRTLRVGDVVRASKVRMHQFAHQVPPYPVALLLGDVPLQPHPSKQRLAVDVEATVVLKRLSDIVSRVAEVVTGLANISLPIGASVCQWCPIAAVAIRFMVRVSLYGAIVTSCTCINNEAESIPTMTIVDFITAIATCGDRIGRLIIMPPVLQSLFETDDVVAHILRHAATIAAFFATIRLTNAPELTAPYFAAETWSSLALTLSVYRLSYIEGAKTAHSTHELGVALLDALSQCATLASVCRDRCMSTDGSESVPTFMTWLERICSVWTHWAKSTATESRTLIADGHVEMHERRSRTAKDHTPPTSSIAGGKGGAARVLHLIENILDQVLVPTAQFLGEANRSETPISWHLFTLTLQLVQAAHSANGGGYTVHAPRRSSCVVGEYSSATPTVHDVRDSDQSQWSHPSRMHKEFRTAVVFLASALDEVIVRKDGDSVTWRHQLSTLCLSGAQLILAAAGHTTSSASLVTPILAAASRIHGLHTGGETNADDEDTLYRHCVLYAITKQP